MDGANTYHHHACQVPIDTFRVLPTLRYSGTFAPSSDVAMLFSQLSGIETAGFKLKHRFAEFDFAEEEEACVAGRVGLAVVGGFGGDIGLAISCVSIGCKVLSLGAQVWDILTR